MLGAQVYPDGRPSAMLLDRVRAAEQLYRAGRVQKLLLSGDHSRIDYDEVGTMREMLLTDGIPARDLFADHAGFDTWDSAQRAQRVFGVTQRRRGHAGLPHGARAVRRPPRRPEGHRLLSRPPPLWPRDDKLQVREARRPREDARRRGRPAPDPKFLGAQIPIAGDGRAIVGTPALTV